MHLVYALGDCGTNCASGTQITTRDECIEAITELYDDSTFRKEVNMESNRPIGCFYGNQDKRGYFNTLTDDSGQTLGWCGVSPVCVKEKGKNGKPTKSFSEIKCYIKIGIFCLKFLFK